MRIDAVEVPRALADTERMAKCIPFKSNDKDRFYGKYGSVLPYFVIAQYVIVNCIVLRYAKPL